MANDPTPQATWPSTIVAVSVIGAIGGIAITAIIKYTTVDDALKFWSALSGLVGLITGAFVTYFFSRDTVQQARADKDRAIRESNTARLEKVAAVQAAGILAGHLDKDDFQQLIDNEPSVKRALSPHFEQT